MSKLEELIAALERATGPSPELDAKIRATLFAGEGAYAAKSPFNGEWCVYKGADRNGREKLHENRSVPHALWIGAYTASIDAAVALVERMLPGKWPDILRDALRELGKQNNWHICLVKPDQERALPTAIVRAALKAKLSQERA